MNIFEERTRKFQSLISQKGIGGAMIRNPYSFRYFTGVGWWQPSIYIPASGDPVIFAFEDEVEELKENTWVSDVLGYRKVEELIRSVVATVRGSAGRTLGFDLDIDSSALLYQMFINMHRDRRVVDVHDLIMELRMIKDETEISLIRRASEIAGKSLKAALEAVRPGATETEVAGEAIYAARKEGAESVHIYVNSGRPRIHAHPRNERIKAGDTVMVDVMPRYEGYYSDKADTVILDDNGDKRKAYQAFSEAVELCSKNLGAGATMEEIEYEAKKVYERNGLLRYYVYGFGHGVGLRFEEAPITTIVVAHRRIKIRNNMIINLGHAPLSGKPIGAVKIEDTYLVKEGGAEKLT
ncbi:MAG: Xaa-Pro peptidase family protein [Candidatus Bathyarchaeia archaeon]|nr:aminopeptidase P family protein [Candidatus Bathyarchaeota archaeon]